MITLEKACEIAKTFLKGKNLDLINNCKDLGDKFVFGYVNKNAPYDIFTGGLLLAVEKETGNHLWYPLGVPGTKNFDSYHTAVRVDIERYTERPEITDEERLNQFLKSMGLEE